MLRIGGSNGLTQPTPITALGVSLNGKFIATGDEHGRVRVFDVEQQAQLAELKVPSDLSKYDRLVKRVSLSDNGRMVLASLRGHERIYLGRTSGQGAMALVTSDGSTTRAVLGPDGEWIAVMSGWLYAYRDTTQKAEHWERNSGGTDVAVNAKGLVGGVFSAPDDQGVARVQTREGKLVATVKVADSFHLARCGWVDEKTLLIVTRKMSHWWDTRAKRVTSKRHGLENLSHHEVIGALGLIVHDGTVSDATGALRLKPRVLCAASADGRVVVSALGASLVLRDPTTLAELSQNPLRTRVWGVAFEPGGEAVWSADAESVRRWKLPNGENDTVFKLPEGFTTEAMTPDASAVLLGDGKVLRLMALPSGEIATTRFAPYSRLPGFSDDGRWLALPTRGEGETRTAVVWDTRTGKPCGKPLVFESGRGAYAMAFDAKGRLFAGNSDGRIYTWRQPPFAVPRRWPLGLAVSPDGKLLAMRSDSSLVDVLQLPSGKLKHSHKVKRREGWSVTFSPNGKWLAASDESQLSIWNAKTGVRLKVVPVPANSFAFSSDSKRMVAGCNGELFVFDVAE